MISSKLVLTLLTAISGYTGYAIPGDLPDIAAVPHDVLEQRVCGRPCEIYGFTFPDGEILVDEALAIGTDPAATSILVVRKTSVLPPATICIRMTVSAFSYASYGRIEATVSMLHEQRRSISWVPPLEAMQPTT